MNGEDTQGNSTFSGCRASASRLITSLAQHQVPSNLEESKDREGIQEMVEGIPGNQEQLGVVACNPKAEIKWLGHHGETGGGSSPTSHGVGEAVNMYRHCSSAPGHRSPEKHQSGKFLPSGSPG